MIRSGGMQLLNNSIVEIHGITHRYDPKTLGSTPLEGGGTGNSNTGTESLEWREIKKV